MEQEKILSTLSEKLGETSFSPQTLQTYVELNPIAEVRSLTRLIGTRL